MLSHWARKGRAVPAETFGGINGDVGIREALWGCLIPPNKSRDTSLQHTVYDKLCDMIGSALLVFQVYSLSHRPLGLLFIAEGFGDDTDSWVRYDEDTKGSLSCK